MPEDDNIQQPGDQVRLVRLDEILTDTARKTRAESKAHVDDLVMSIGTLGLIHPLVVGEDNSLVAGWHRLAAIRRILAVDVARFERLFPGRVVPVRVVALGDEPDRVALEVADAENSKRRQFTPEEVLAIVERLKKFADMRQGPGRPGKDEQTVTAAVACATGLSKRTVREKVQRAREAAQHLGSEAVVVAAAPCDLPAGSSNTDTVEMRRIRRISNTTSATLRAVEQSIDAFLAHAGDETRSPELMALQKAMRTVKACAVKLRASSADVDSEALRDGVEGAGDAA